MRPESTETMQQTVMLTSTGYSVAYGIVLTPHDYSLKEEQAISSSYEYSLSRLVTQMRILIKT